MAQKEVFSDIALGFTAHPITGQLSRKKNADAVKQSVKSLILTDFYERPFKPNIGCNIRSSLFELFTPVTQQKMETAVREVIENYEPRAELIDVIVTSNIDDNIVRVKIVFYVRNNQQPISVEVFLERTR